MTHRILSHDTTVNPFIITDLGQNSQTFLAASENCRKLTVGSLFAGIGGFDLGLERTGGFEIKWQVEIDEYCRRVLGKHWPHVKRYGDIRECGAELGRVDIIVGGFPCKQTSTIAAVHQRRHGLNGQDSGLWWDYLRIVSALRPPWVIVENVAGVKAWANSITLGLEGLGYGVSQSEYQACDFGAPHSRRRVFFIANLDGKGFQAPRPRNSPSLTSGEWPAPPDDLWREHQPGTWRMADGIPNRVERIRALGNAVVPQIVTWLGHRILEAHYA